MYKISDCPYPDIFSFFVTRNLKKSKKLMKIVNIEENLLYRNLLNDLRNFNGIFKKDVNYDNIKSHKKAGLHPLSEKSILDPHLQPFYS